MQLVPIVLTLLISGCTYGTSNWYCGSEIDGIMNACTKLQMESVKKLPPKCPASSKADIDFKMKINRTRDGVTNQEAEFNLDCINKKQP